MNLLRSYLDNAEKNREQAKGMRVRFIGDISVLDEDLRKKIRKAEQESAAETGLTVNIAVNYGGRDEIVKAAKELAEEYRAGNLSLTDMTEDKLSAHMYTAGQPEPDLIIRPSGEQRLSNFLVWQAAYAEFVFMDTLWPDFHAEQLNEALWEYASRNRRFGGI